MFVATLSGYIAKEGVKIHHTEKSSVANWTLRVNSFKEGGQVMYANCRLWGKRGEAVSKYCDSGRQLTIIGKPTNFKVKEGPEGGSGYVSCDVDVIDMIFPEKLPGSDASGYRPKMQKPAQDLPDRSEDLPF